MSKRSAPEPINQRAKRHCPGSVPHITRLSDELLLRIAFFLPANDLISCQRVSKRFERISCDGQIWKALFYARFVRPRASRIPGLAREPSSSLHYSSRGSRWLQDEDLARTSKTKWKVLYKLRHNWNRGSCGVSKINIAEAPPLPPPLPPLIKLHEGLAITADPTSGLRAWSLQCDRELIAVTELYQGSLSPGGFGAPTAIAVGENSDSKRIVDVVVGFECGGFGLYQLDMGGSPPELTLRYTHLGPISSAGGSRSHGMITSIAYSLPYLLTMTSSQVLTAYRFSTSADTSMDRNTNKGTLISGGRMIHSPKILSSLRSHTAWPPLSLSLRRSAQNSIVASVVYSFPLYTSGWSVGIQELRFTDDADTAVDSRIAMAVPSGFTRFGKPTSGGAPQAGSSGPQRGGDGTGDSPGSRPLQTTDTHSARPSSISYTHPYLLASHADNTLTLYMVKSNAGSLTIDSGQRLWGHTSAVSTALVSCRGKAVSLSKKGSELRVWELEGGVSEKRRLNASVKVEPQVTPQNGVTSLWCADDMGWLGGFDEEKVVVLREQDEGKLALIVYDFTL